MFGEHLNPSPNPPRSPVVSLASLFATGPWRVLWILHGLLQVYRQVLDEAALQGAGLTQGVLLLRGGDRLARAVSGDGLSIPREVVDSRVKPYRGDLCMRIAHVWRRAIFVRSTSRGRA